MPECFEFIYLNAIIDLGINKYPKSTKSKTMVDLVKHQVNFYQPAKSNMA